MSREEQLLQLLENERRLRQQAEDERRQAEDERRQLERQMQPTTLPDFLDACHVHLSVGFSSRINYKTGTKGDPENADSKLRPDYISEWTTFPQEQSAIWKDLFDDEFLSQGHFTSLHTLKELGASLRKRSLGSELDLGYYERYTVEDHVSSAIEILFLDPRLRRIFNLKGEVKFENHGNTITSEERSVGPPLDLEMVSPQTSPVRKRQKRVNESKGSLNTTSNVRLRSSRPRADQFCVYNTSSEETVPAFVIEYKAPHKLTLAIIEAGLVAMTVDDVVVCTEGESPVIEARRKVAAVITQAFSYMIQGGLEYGYVCTGETFIFLHILADDPSTVYYYLSVPNNDVGATTGWRRDSDDNNNNRLHMTAVGQVLAFTLRALRTPQHSQDWRAKAHAQLKTWVIQENIIFKSDSEESDGALSDYKQNRQSRNEYMRTSPIKTRSKGPVTAPPCRPPHERRRDWDTSEEEDNSSRNSAPSTNSPSAGRGSKAISSSQPTQKSGSNQNKDKGKEKMRQFCTQKCLLGLLHGGSLDRNCPNVATHGETEHRIDRYEFRRLVQAQILRKDFGPFGCESMNIHGTTGALFRLTLFSHGYTLVAKGAPVETINRAVYEEYLYRHLRPIQGVHIPVCLGSIDISSRPLWYDGIAAIVHLLFLSHAGRRVRFHAGPNNLKTFATSASESLQAVHRLGVLHRDPHNDNLLWNAENKHVMLIDFERAKILNEQDAVQTESLKRKRGENDTSTSLRRSFKRELKCIAKNMAG
ncbi:hypothetical protein LOZ61_003510 [Ophidiomyces ophidiicola]|uniref:Uncharacterized protein n=1 Tax=Ophidiomyces ophidiicola TaxID=1387563 RepID=A0ACB8UUM8_9EURO|nr:hypothetical protein LOZ61_003510 [Ophidiomyces ophidiicola]KAI1920085.1 hypothetical protein LOZ60_006692 [Ophidiomyces ophidiicola]KAI1963548.1 hypothetical protein LOZ59_001747 [Ophidiomyces ophidiicola]KAI1970738.1 hypothetical protein LOZ56_003488 [Ophidiomyces ophidiicola]KAI2027434.1 hypothetical protein LOZ48_004748 [Ophidiomyces ophidiicola]